jgi:hypothetical protein
MGLAVFPIAKGPDLIIQAEDETLALREGGAHSLTLAEDSPIIRRAEDTRRGRPWSHAARDQ